MTAKNRKSANKLSTSILNYFAAFTETKFNFRTLINYRWTNNELTLDLAIFQDFQDALLQRIKAGDNTLEMEIDSTKRYIEFLTKVKRRVVSPTYQRRGRSNGDLTGLIKLDILEQTGKGRGTRYIFKKKWFAGNLSKIYRRFDILHDKSKVVYTLLTLYFGSEI